MGLSINSIARINLDLKQIQLNYTINDNALWVVKQIPGLVDYGDMTPLLREGKIYSKTCLKQRLKNRQNKGLNP